ncbi:MAG: transposase, partial [Cardiobacteriaceae bacterium]|nr:transposase [Cardiobacteriaceae bacterium]
IMRKGKRGRSLAQAERARNKRLSKTRYVIEQSFGTLHRRFCHKRARYFGWVKVAAQSHLKAICVNLLKAGNRPDIGYFRDDDARR